MCVTSIYDLDEERTKLWPLDGFIFASLRRCVDLGKVVSRFDDTEIYICARNNVSLILREISC